MKQKGIFLRKNPLNQVGFLKNKGGTGLCSTLLYL